MKHFHSEFEVHAPLDVVADFHGSTDVLPLLTPPGMQVELRRGGAVEEGMIAEFTMRLGPIEWRWVARHEDVHPTGFTDVQDEGPLPMWRHTHRFVAAGRERTRVIDDVRYELPAFRDAPLTRLMFSKAALAGLFTYRGLQTKRHCRRLHEGGARRLRNFRARAEMSAREKVR